MNLITVIIPVYNVEKYLDKCVESVVNQTYSNLEILLVDDGSKDRCGVMCDEWASRDARIKVIHKENGGLSDARNAALDIAKGEYITCIDSDDYVTTDYVEYLYRLVSENNCDISCCGMRLVSEDGSTISGSKMELDKPVIFKSERALEEMLYGKYFSNSACCKLYKTELFSGVRYPKDKLFEDMYTTYKLIVKSDRMVYGSEKKYYYLCRPTGISGNKNPYRRLDAVDAEQEVLNYAKRYVPGAVRAAECRMLSEAISCLVKFDLNSKEDKDIETINMLWNNIKGYRIATALNSKVVLKFRMLALFALFGKHFVKFMYKKLVKGWQ